MDRRVCDIPELVSATLHDSFSFLYHDVVVDSDIVVANDIAVPDILDVASVFDDGSIGETQESLPLTIPPPAELVEPLIVLSDEGSVWETQELFPLIVLNPEPVLLPVQENATFIVLEPPRPLNMPFSLSMRAGIASSFFAQDFFRHFICSQSRKDAFYHLKKTLTLYAIMKLLE